MIREAYIELLYQHKDLFIEWYEVFPQLFHMMISVHEAFVQEYLAPLLEKGWYIEENVFWRLLVQILSTNADWMNLDKITNMYSKFRMIENLELQSAELAILHENKVFKKFLYNAGKDFFVNDSSSHWSYYAYGSDKSDRVPIKCFEFIEWDIDIVEKLNSAYKELEESFSMRENPDSKNNANIRRTSYDEVISKYNKEIVQTICGAKKEIAEYQFIQSSLQKQSLI